MKARLAALSAVAATVLLLAGCGPAGSRTTTLQKLPAPATSGAAAGAAVAGAPSLASPYAEIVYRLGGALPPLPATAPAYDVSAGPGDVERRRIASALGVAPSDRHLLIDARAGGSWSFDVDCEAPAGTDGTAGFACASAATTAIAPAIVCAAAPTPAPPTPVAPTPAAPTRAAPCPPQKAAPPVAPVDLPSQQVAVARARALFNSLGVDVRPDGLHLTDGITQWSVSADPVIGGLPTSGRTTTVTIGPKSSILAARGFLGGTTTKLGDYRLADAATTGFARLVDEEAHRPRPMVATYMPCQVNVPNCGGPPVPQVVTITGVHLALLQIGTTLVPAFVFEAGSNETAPAVPAVIDSLLQRVKPTVPPAPAPKPVPGQPGQSPGAPPAAGAPTKP